MTLIFTLYSFIVPTMYKNSLSTINRSVSQSKALKSLFNPKDIDLAHEIFGANCGPISFATFMEKTVCESMRYFQHFPAKQWTTVGHMEHALMRNGAAWARIDGMLPEAGVALIEFTGSWSNHWAGRLKRTHWITCRCGQVFDSHTEQWQSQNEWRTSFLPKLIDETPRCTGWGVITGLDIVRHAACEATNGSFPERDNENLICIGIGSDAESCSMMEE